MANLLQSWKILNPVILWVPVILVINPKSLSIKINKTIWWILILTLKDNFSQPVGMNQRILRRILTLKCHKPVLIWWNLKITIFTKINFKVYLLKQGKIVFGLKRIIPLYQIIIVLMELVLYNNNKVNFMNRLIVNKKGMNPLWILKIMTKMIVFEL